MQEPSYTDLGVLATLLQHVAGVVCNAGTILLDALIASDAFLRASRFEEVVSGLERSLSHPGELADERKRVAREVLGEIDGRAADRTVEAIVETVSPSEPARRA